MTPQKLRALMEIHKTTTTDLVQAFNVSRQLVWHWRNKSIGQGWQYALKQYFAKITTDKIMNE